MNYGGHVGHDTLLGLVHEARVQLLATKGFTELDIEGVGIAVVDSVTVHAAEARHGMTLVFELSVGDIRPRGFALFCRVSDRASGREVARLRMGHVFFDYGARKVTRTPPGFREAFASAAPAA